MANYSVANTRDNLSSLIDKALAGEEVVISRHGKPTVALSVVATKQMPTADERHAIYERLRRHRETMPMINVSSADIIRQMRDEGIG